jgi:hypothetical protein
VLQKGGKLTIPVSLKPGSIQKKAELKLETVLGPVKNFGVMLIAK